MRDLPARLVAEEPADLPPLATLVSAPFDDPGWLFEVKWDGFRVEAVVDGGSLRLWTRGQQDAAAYFGDFLVPPGWNAAKRAIVDGEVIALDEQGEPDFALLQDRIKHRRVAGPGASCTRSSTCCTSSTDRSVWPSRGEGPPYSTPDWVAA
jgi:ATP-dependent DNA ligase